MLCAHTIRRLKPRSLHRLAVSPTAGGAAH
jgi:hypothetical protein